MIHNLWEKLAKDIIKMKMHLNSDEIFPATPIISQN